MDVAILDPLPLFAHGVVAALGCGTALRSAEQLRAWLKDTTGGVVVLTLQDDESWACLAEASTRNGIATLAVLPDFTVLAAATALRAGAAQVVERCANPRKFTETVQEVMIGKVSLPLDILRATVAARPGSHHGAPNDDELEWLRGLAKGTTVTELATRHNLSERALYRRLNELYRRIGVDGRTQALMLARDEGWL